MEKPAAVEVADINLHVPGIQCGNIALEFLLHFLIGYHQ
jgi:hypothetical protein